MTKDKLKHITFFTYSDDSEIEIKKHLETMNTTVPFQAEKPIFRKVESIADMALLTRDEREYYHISLDSFRTNLAVMEHERNTGLAEGLEKGRAEGRMEEKRATARNLKSLNFPIATIAQATGLTIEEIMKL